MIRCPRCDHDIDAGGGCQCSPRSENEAQKGLREFIEAQKPMDADLAQAARKACDGMLSASPSAVEASSLLAELERRAEAVDQACKRSNQMERDFLEKKVLNSEANEALADFGRKRGQFGEYLLQRSDEIIAALRGTPSSEAAPTPTEVADFVRAGPSEGESVQEWGHRIVGKMMHVRRSLVSASEPTPHLAAELSRLRNLINTPELQDFDKGVPLECAHQVERWGEAHDRSKSAENWYWLVGYLAGKALRASIGGDREKALHHTISAAAALRNWHQAIKRDTSGAGVGADEDLAVLDPLPDAEGGN